MFYERLNALCHLHGTTITEVAVTQLNVASSAPTSWKKGSTPRADTVVRAAEYFGVSADYLLGLTDAPLQPTKADSNASDVNRVFARLCSASPTARAAAIAAMEAVIESIDK